MIDTHIHLNDEAYNECLEQIIKDANSIGVNKMIVMGCDYLTSKKAIEIANKYENIYAMIGLHPSEVEKETDNRNICRRGSRRYPRRDAYLHPRRWRDTRARGLPFP